MQPPCSLQAGPCGPASSLGAQSGTPILQHLGEKQLFEKFWKGTFKAVATPRTESVIMASITARRRVTDSEPAARQPLVPDERRALDIRLDTADRNGCIKTKGRKRHSHRRVRSPSFDEDLSPQPKAKKKKKKKKRKSERKRKRSPSHSLSPLRKKKKKMKKKKKKSSKKSKRHRCSSKKSKHGSSGLKHKRKDERKHKKSSRTHSRRRRRRRGSASDSSSCHSYTGDRHHWQKSVVHQRLGELAAAGEETNGVLKWRPATKSVCKTAPKYRSILSTSTILSSKPGSELLHGEGPQHLSSQTEGPHDYDSGNDTSSPPSSKTGVSRASVTDKKNSCRRLASPEKLKFTDRDNVSDSGNSVTSYASLCKPYGEEGLSASLFSGNCKREQITLGCRVEAVRSPKTSSCSRGMSELSRRQPKAQSPSSRSRSRSSGSSRYSRHHSPSPSPSSSSSYSRSSYSADARRRGSVVSLSSSGSYSRRSANRLRGRKRTSRSRETDWKYTHKGSGKRRRRKSYSPMKKRRRDSPSHLEARRITSARKRPIPYFRPSPSSSSRCTSVSSWSSLFTRGRSRSHSYSSYRSYSRSSSWNSIFGTRSRSRSRGALNKRNKARR